ncbi:MAG: ABC transporter substrate-binding protein [Alteromonadaceae bacterium]|nr:ABC transporter substrate-binding protein [Alteromonadaceae bacterium]
MSFTKQFSLMSLVFLMITFSFPTLSMEKSPYNLLAKVGHKLFNDIATLSAEQRKQPKIMRALIEKDLMPYIDYRYTAYKILGKYVKTATKEQRNAFVAVMRNYLAITYAQALTQYKDQQVKFERDKKVGNKRITVVRTEIIEQGAPTIKIDFKFRKNKSTGYWKAFDMVVEGISLLSSKQAEITRQIRRTSLDAVIETLQRKTEKV